VSGPVADTLLGVLRLGGYVGYVLVAGTIAFASLIWPDGFRDRLLARVGATGAVVALLTTVGTPVVQAWARLTSLLEVSGRTDAVAALIRSATLVLILTLLPELTGQHAVGAGPRIAAGVAAGSIAVTYVIQSDALSIRWPVVALIATSAHIFATAAWLGGLVALAIVVIPRSNRDALHAILPRFSRLAVAGVVTLTVTGVIHALLAADGIRPLLSSSYGLVLILKVALFAIMLLLGNQGRAYATRLARRELEDFDATAAPAGLRVLAVAVGAELALAFGVLAMTSLLVAVAPVSG